MKPTQRNEKKFHVHGLKEQMSFFESARYPKQSADSGQSLPKNPDAIFYRSRKKTLVKCVWNCKRL